MKRTLTKYPPTKSLVSRAFFAVPQLAFGDADEIPPAANDPPAPNAGEDDVAPDFSSIKTVAVDPKESEPDPALSEHDAGVKTPEEIKAEADAAAEAKRAEDEKIEADRLKAESDAKKKDEPADKDKVKEITDAEKAAAAEEARKSAEADKIPDDDKDIEDLQPPKGTSEKGVADFNKMRELIKGERGKARALETQMKAVKLELETAKSAGEIPEDVKKELTDLRARLGVEDPVVMKEFNEKLTATQSNLVAELKALGLGSKLSPEEQKDFFEKELWEQDAEWWQDKVLDKLGKDFITRERIKAGLVARDSALRERTAKAKEIQANPGEWEKRQQEEAAKSTEQFTKDLRDTVSEHQKDKDWANFKEITKETPADQKALFEAHNKAVEERTGKFRDDVLAVYNRDPKAIGRIVFTAHEAEQLRAQNTQLAKDLADAQKLVAEHEELIAASRKAGSIVHRSSDTPAPVAKQAARGEIEIGNTSEMLAPDFGSLGKKG